MTSAGMVSLALSFPETVRRNDYWRERYPDVVAKAEEQTLARLWSEKHETTPATAAFDAEMAPFLKDPFRGTVERRVLLPGETSLSLQLKAARDALGAAGMEAADIGLTLVSTFYPEQLDVGNAAFVARDLGLRGAAWNLESACASSVVGFQTACGLVRAGQYESVLVVACCRYSHVMDDADTLSWFLADGAGAFVVGRVPEGEGYIAGQTVHTADTCGVFFPALVVDESGAPRVRMRAARNAGQVLRASSEKHLVDCCSRAARTAGVRIEDIDFFVFNTPTAWFSSFAARALGIDLARTTSTYHRYANVGPALMPANLHHAASAGLIEPGDLVMLYAVGSVSSASAVVMRWGEVSLGPAPP
jgi:3-oxoacyl-[acyl-carrier-protein] synthase III